MKKEKSLTDGAIKIVNRRVELFVKDNYIIPQKVFDCIYDRYDTIEVNRYDSNDLTDELIEVINNRISHFGEEVIFFSIMPFLMQKMMRNGNDYYIMKYENNDWFII